MSESKGIVIEEQELREMARSARGCIKGPHLAAQQQCGSHQPAVRLRR